ERRRYRCVQNFDLAAQDFDFARGQLGIAGAFGSQTHQTSDTYAELVTDTLCRSKGFNVIGINHDLRQTGTISQVDEDDAPVVATAMHPAKQGDRLVKMIFTNLAGVAGTH